MNSSSADSKEVSKQPPSEQMVVIPQIESTDVEAVLATSTPKTLPLKREVSPLFVPAVLPNQTENSPVVDTDTDESVSESHGPLSESEVKIEGETTSEQETDLLNVEFLPPPDTTYQASLTLELRCPEPKAKIHYAIGADDVGEEGLCYEPRQKIFLTQSSQIVAKAFLNGRSGPLCKAQFEISQPGWQKIEPTDQSDPTPHEMSDDANLEGRWQLVAASVRGKLHAHRGLWREDAFRHGLAHASDGTYSIIVVSDGAGSVPLSRVGSNLLCQVTLEFLLASFTNLPPLAKEQAALVEHDLPAIRSLLVESGRVALQKLRDEADKRSRPLSDFSSTLLILVRREWNGQQLCAALQAGDGSIALWNGDNTLTLLGEADHGQHSSETRFLTTNGMEAELPARVKFSIRPSLRAVAIMTDGVSDDFFPEPVRFPELFDTLLSVVEDNPIERGKELLSWISYDKKGSSDDRTLVLCWHVADADSKEENDGQS